MKNYELQELLKTFPPEAEVRIYPDQSMWSESVELEEEAFRLDDTGVVPTLLIAP